MLKNNDLMYLSSRLACLVGLLVFPMLGCSDVGGGGGTGGSADAGGAAGQGGASAGTGGIAGSGGEPAIEFVTLFVTVLDQDVTPLDGADVCETDTDNCTVTNANGRATIDVAVPADGRISFTYAKDGYLPTLLTDVVDEDFTGMYDDSRTVTDEAMVAFSKELMTPYPFQGTGTALISVLTTEVNTVPLSGVPGVVMELVGASGVGYYWEADGTTRSRDLPSTTIDGWGGFVEVAPADVEILLHGAPANCILQLGWPGREPNSVTVPVRAGFMSYSGFFCPPF